MRYPRSIAAAAIVGILAVLLGATVYEAAVALGVIDLGSVPGEGAPGASIVRTVALMATLVGAGLAAVLAAGRRGVAGSELLAPAAAAFLLARFYTFDPYYLPTLRRLSEDGFVPPALVYVLVGLCLAAALLTRARPRVGLLSSAPLIVACGLIAWGVEGGH